MLLLLCSNRNQQLWKLTPLTMSELVQCDEHVFGKKDPYFFIPTCLKHHECNLLDTYISLSMAEEHLGAEND